LVHRPVDRRNHHKLGSFAALICCIALLGGCGESSTSDSEPVSNDIPGPTLSASIRVANCRDWREGSAEQRRNTVVALRNFAGGPVGSSTVMTNGRVLEDGSAYSLLEGYCAKRFAGGFKLYKLYERAAGFVGR
jgi:hypothetical protein